MTALRKVWIKGSPGEIDELVIHGYDVSGGATDVSVHLGAQEMPTVEVAYYQDDVTLDIEAIVEAFGVHHPDTRKVLDALKSKAHAMRQQCDDGDRCQHAEGIDIAADIVSLMARGETS